MNYIFCSSSLLSGGINRRKKWRFKVSTQRNLFVLQMDYLPMDQEIKQMKSTEERSKRRRHLKVSFVKILFR